MYLSKKSIKKIFFEKETEQVQVQGRSKTGFGAVGRGRLKKQEQHVSSWPGEGTGVTLLLMGG